MLGTQDAESGKELIVNCMCVVKKHANDTLNSLDVFGGERGAVQFHMGEMG